MSSNDANPTPGTRSEQRPPVQANSTTSQNLHNIMIVARREYLSRVREQGFLITTAVLSVLVILAVFVPTFVQALSVQTQTSLTVVNTAGPLANTEVQPLLDSLLNASPESGASSAKPSKPPFLISAATPEKVEALRQDLRSGQLTHLLLIDRKADGDLHFVYQTAESPINATALQVRAAITELTRRDRLARLGVPASQQASVFAEPDFLAENIFQSGRSQSDLNATMLLAFAGISLLSTAVTIYGASVGSGVAEEKNSRVMEVLINVVTPFQLMVGKILGIGLVGLTQIGGLAVAGVLALTFQGQVRTALLGEQAASGGVSIWLAGYSMSLLGLILLYFLLGYLLYGTLYAGIGAMVSRQEEVGPAGSVLSTLLMAGFLASWYAAISPQATWVQVGSYIPFFTPTLMLARLGTGGLAWWEIVLSSAVMLLFTLACAAVVARIYRVGVLMYGQKPSLRRAFEMLRQG